MGVERHAGALSESTNLLKRAVQVRAGLRVHRNDVGARLGKRLNILLGFDDHEVNVDHALRRSSDGFDHHGADCDVRHEATIHDIDVDPVGARLVDGLDFSLEAAKIGRKHRRRDSKRLWRAGHGSSQAPQGHRVNGIPSLTRPVPAKDNGKTPQGRADELR